MELSPLEKLTYNNEVLVSTTDNPINPFLDYDGWYAEDQRLGHDTCGLIARLFTDYPDMSNEDSAIEYARVIRVLFQIDSGDLYTLVKRPQFNENVQAQ